jgi:inner membrane protein
LDTGTHIVMGIALGGLATLDPTVSSHLDTKEAVMIGAIAGSLIPDIDTILKLRNNAKYIRNHRGITHSIPAVLLWPLLITFILHLVFRDAHLLDLWMWTFIGVIIHVFVDIFNAYGTQAFRPFSQKWVALGIINTFDPYFFTIHIIGIIIWAIGGSPGPTFITVFGVIIVYYFIRIAMNLNLRHKIKKQLPNVEKIIISPTMRFNRWHLAIIAKNHFYVGNATNGEIKVHDVFERMEEPSSALMEAAKQDENLSAFLSFSPIYRFETAEYSDHIEVRFIDLRYRSKGYYPFVAVVQLDFDLNIICSYTGWIFSEKKLRKKLDYLPN